MQSLAFKAKMRDRPQMTAKTGGAQRTPKITPRMPDGWVPKLHSRVTADCEPVLVGYVLKLDLNRSMALVGHYDGEDWFGFAELAPYGWRK